MAVRFQYNGTEDKIIDDTLRTKDTLLFVATEAQRLMNPYVPMQMGTLANNSEAYVDGGRGKIVYKQQYARRMYYGDTFNFSRLQHPKATSRWKEVMMAERRADLISTVQNFVRKHNG